MEFKGYKKNVSWKIESINDFGSNIPDVTVTAKNIVEAAEKFQQEKPGATILRIEKSVTSKIFK